MGIRVEFNPDLALRNFEEYTAGRRQMEECLPEVLEAGRVYDFLKKEQRLYWLLGELPLVETKGDQKLSLPLASVVIVEVTHTLVIGEVWTKGKYKVVEVFAGSKVHFNGFVKV
ncbi:MAG: hypothetical protein JWN18_243 [Parcubacteria group bacterium]|nr:hypothetical protein [Parcubacteria group bacterium]